MIRIVHPPISSIVGRFIEFTVELALRLPPEPNLPLPVVRRSMITVDKAVGDGKPNQKTDVLLVRLMLNLVAGSDETFRDLFKSPLPHVPTFDEALGSRIRVYQKAGGFSKTRTLFPPPNPQVVLSFLGKPAGSVSATAPEKLTASEPLFVDGVIDPCPPDRDRGSRSGMVYTIVHLNYHLLVTLRALGTFRLAPKLIKFIDAIKDANLKPLRDELDRAENSDPDRPPIPKPQPSLQV
jgi:hypothetical protein